MGEPFAHEHVEFTRDGLLSKILCQSCGTEVASLEERPSRKFPGRTFSRLRYHANMVKRSALFSDGTTATVFLCGECRNTDMDPHVDNVGKQIQTAMVREMEAHRRPARDVDALKARVRNLRPLTRAEASARQTLPVTPPPPKPLP